MWSARLGRAFAIVGLTASEPIHQLLKDATSASTSF